MCQFTEGVVLLQCFQTENENSGHKVQVTW